MTPLRIPALLTALLALAALAPPAARAVDADSAAPLSSFPTEPVAVETRSARRHVFRAWRAETAEQREQGLMFVKSMAEDEAMIFLYEPPQYVAMWMKNTFLPLDMLFVDARGCVVGVKERATPHSLATIESGGPVAVVVELNAGTVAARGIRRGDRLLRPSAGWPRDTNAPCPAPR